ncbi:hypothetical protein LTR66_000980 [Elasticomyces elasticus]|nr:hypothetical protein LTR66_000980 [Elasticomyces elasticus]KAK5008001.1 hypothetical protein LTR28_004573 [Elasticomyces elasticus]
MIPPINKEALTFSKRVDIPQDTYKELHARQGRSGTIGLAIAYRPHITQSIDKHRQRQYKRGIYRSYNSSKVLKGAEVPNAEVLETVIPLPKTLLADYADCS